MEPFFFLGKFGYLDKYQLPRNDGQPFPSPELLRTTFMNSIPSHIIVQPLLVYYLLYPAMQRHGSTMIGPLPSVVTFFWQMFLSIMFIDFTFYLTHRILHTSYFYQSVHRKHHEYKWTIGFAAEYAHLIEDIFSAGLPTVILPIYLGFHGSTFWFWLIYRLWATYEAHSGYAFPWSIFYEHSIYHDYHHTKNSGNYGENPFFDSIFQTNQSWQKNAMRNSGMKPKEQ